ncbi:MAG: NADPH:quinone reductase [Candidatus Limnocylindrales bacterium]
MQAAIYTRHGPAREVLSLAELPDPQPGPGEVRVRICVSGVNPTDWKSRSSGGPLPDGPLPSGGTGPIQVPGQDGAGVIDRVGPGVDPARVGQRVWVYHAAAGRWNGTAAQYTCVPAAQAVPLPDAVRFEQGAGLGIPFITAHRAVFADGPVTGRRVLVTGGAGAVGNAAVQFAVLGGAEVFATASSEEKRGLTMQAGAMHAFDYRSPGYVAAVRSAAPEGVDRIVDVAIAANLTSDLEVLAPQGTVVAYASDAADPLLPVRRLMTANAKLEFVLVYNLTQPMLEAAVEAITGALQAGRLRPLPSTAFPLAEIAAAHEAVEGHAVGKVLVEIP